MVVPKARKLLGKPVHQAKHIPSLHWQDVPAFYATLEEGSVSHLALRLLILTGVRTATVRQCRLEHIEGDVWIIPAELMKGRVGQTEAFRVPLSSEALRIIEDAKAHERSGYLFPGQRGKGPMSDMTMSQLMARRGMEERPHGFRASLRTWLADCTDAPFEVAETVLQHTVGSAVVRAYQRSDHLEQRRALLERWADHVTGGSGQIVRMIEHGGN